MGRKQTLSVNGLFPADCRVIKNGPSTKRNSKMHVVQFCFMEKSQACAFSATFFVTFAVNPELRYNFDNKRMERRFSIVQKLPIAYYKS
jgi:hypothetical protein